MNDRLLVVPRGLALSRIRGHIPGQTAGLECGEPEDKLTDELIGKNIGSLWPFVFLDAEHKQIPIDALGGMRSTLESKPHSIFLKASTAFLWTFPIVGVPTFRNNATLFENSMWYWKLRKRGCGSTDSAGRFRITPMSDRNVPVGRPFTFSHVLGKLHVRLT